MKNQSVAIVGGASGLGLATGRLMLNHGARRIALIDKNEDALETAAADLKAQGGDVIKAVGDISRRDAAHAVFNEVAKAFGRVDSLINCAAIYPRRDILEITDEEWDLENAINIKGT